MSERTFKIADAILDSAIEEYRNINLANEEAVEQYAFEAMGESITSEEARAILDACNEYLALIESPDFNGEGQNAFDHIIGALKDFRLSHGGQRIGAGRKNAGTKAVLVRLTDEQHETLKGMGGSNWLQKELDKLKGHKMIDTKNFTEEQQHEFIAGWEAAGGYTDDLEESPVPWCCPWLHGNTVIEVEGDDIESWGAQWWDQCKDEIEELLKSEESEEN